MSTATSVFADVPAGRRIAVVGGAGGIGRALVAHLLAGGARVAVLDLDASLVRHPPPAGVTAIGIDASDAASVSRAFEMLRDAFGALDGLVNLAGFTAEKAPIAETGETVWDEVVDGNLKSVFLVARAAVPLLAAGSEASLVLISSGLAVKPAPGYGPYAASKAGVLALTRLLAQENAPAIRVNAVAPGAVDTAFLTGGTGRGGDDGARGLRFDRAAYERTIPLGRIAVPDDVVGPIVFFLSPAARYVTGQTLHVNGGLHMA